MRRVLPSILLAILLVVVLFLLIGVRPGRAEGTPSRHILVLIDESGSIRGANANDPDGKRIRFAQFLVRYLQAFYPAQAQVGVTGFISDTEPVLPSMDVARWSEADMAALARGLARIAEQRGDTRFVPVLEDALETMQAFDCSREAGLEDACDVVLFTDGLWETSTGENRDVISETLHMLRSAGISVVVVMFAGSPQSVRYAEDEYLQTWELGATRVISNATMLEAQIVYQEILQALAVDEPLTRLSVREFEGTTTITMPVPLFQRYTRLLLLPDNRIDEAWTPEPGIRAGVERWWFDPPAGEIRATLQASGETTQTLLYYSYLNEPYPISLEAQVIPDRQEVGQPVQLWAWFTVGRGRVITDASGVGVQAAAGRGEIYPLIPSPDGRFFYTLTKAAEGDYRVRFDAVTTPASHFPSVCAIERSLRTGYVPHLRMSTSFSSTSSLSTTIVVTVAVENLSADERLYTPTLEIVESGARIYWEHCGRDDCVGLLQAEVNSVLTLRASLSAGETSRGIPFPAQYIERQMIMAPPMVHPNSQEPIWARPVPPLVLLVVIAIIVLATIVLVKITMFRPRQRRMAGLLLNLTTASDEEINETLKAFRKGGLPHMREDIRAVGRMISRFYRYKTAEVKDAAASGR